MRRNVRTRLLLVFAIATTAFVAPSADARTEDAQTPFRSETAVRVFHATPASAAASPVDAKAQARKVISGTATTSSHGTAWPPLWLFVWIAVATVAAACAHLRTPARAPPHLLHI